MKRANQKGKPIGLWRSDQELEIFSPAQLKMSIYWKEFFVIYLTVLEFAHMLLEAVEPTTVLTESKKFTRSFLKKLFRDCGKHALTCCNLTSN